MALDDFFETEVGIAVAATAALFSPKARKALRRGAVYGVAGALMAGDAIAAFARGVGRGAQQAAASATRPASERAQPTAAPTAPATPGIIRKAEDMTAEAARTVRDPAAAVSYHVRTSTEEPSETHRE